MKILSLNSNCQVINNPVKTSSANLEPNDSYVPSSDEKPATQHAAYASYGASSACSIGTNLNKLLGIATHAKVSQCIPGLNLFVAGLETYNTVKYISEKDRVMAGNAASNAASCLGSFLEDASIYSGIMGNLDKSPALIWASSALGVVAGALAIGVGCAEVKEAKKTDSKKTLTLGILDLASGASSVTGAVLMSSGFAASLGIPLLIASSACDISSIIVDYMWKEKNKPSVNDGKEQCPSHIQGEKKEDVSGKV